MQVGELSLRSTCTLACSNFSSRNHCINPLTNPTAIVPRRLNTPIKWFTNLPNTRNEGIAAKLTLERRTLVPKARPHYFPPNIVLVAPIRLLCVRLSCKYCCIQPT